MQIGGGLLTVATVLSQKILCLFVYSLMFMIIKSVKTECHLGLTDINPGPHVDIYVYLWGSLRTGLHLEATLLTST